MGSFFIPQAIIDRLTFSTYNSQDANQFASNRLDQWPVALDLISRHPFQGNGPHAFETYNAAYIGVDEIQLHNVFLNISVEYGLFGLFLYLIVIFSIVYSIWEKNDPDWSKWIAVILLFSWFIIAFTGIWAYSVPAWFLFAWLMRIPTRKTMA